MTPELSVVGIDLAKSLFHLVGMDERGTIIIPTVSPLIIPLLYCSINGFQRASSVERPLPGGEKRIDGWAAHPVAWCGDGGVSSPVCATGVSLIARGCLIGATPRGQPWTSAVTALMKWTRPCADRLR